MITFSTFLRGHDSVVERLFCMQKASGSVTGISAKRFKVIGNVKDSEELLPVRMGKTGLGRPLV